MTTSISEIRKDFPLLMSNDVIYLDTAGDFPEAVLCSGGRENIL